MRETTRWSARWQKTYAAHSSANRLACNRPRLAAPNRAADDEVVGVERDVTHKRVHRRPKAKMKQLPELPGARAADAWDAPADDELSARGLQTSGMRPTPPTRLHTPWGRVVVEAQFSGIPAVGSDVGGLAQNVGDAGLILNPAAPVRRVGEHGSFVVGQPEQYEQLSQRARRKADSYWKNAASDALRLVEISE